MLKRLVNPRLALIALCLVIVGVVSTRYLPRHHATVSSPAQQTSLNADSAETPQTDFSDLPRLEVGRHNFPGLNPGEVGWETEAFHDQAAAQLKRLAERITSSDAQNVKFFESLLTDDFRCDNLRPADLESVYVDASRSLTVRRPHSSAADLTGYVGVAGFANALDRMLSPLGKENERRINFKVVRVQFDNKQVDTTVLFHASSQGNKVVQQNASWNVRWRVGSEGGLPRISRISVDPNSYEEIAFDGTALFSDCTTAVLDGNSSFREQLLHSQSYWTSRIEVQYGVDTVGFHGAAVGDVNNDGLDDIYFCMPGGLPNRLYLQNPDGTASDGSAKAGLDFCDFTRHALLVDLDNDGDQDLAALINSSVLFLENNGAGQFQVQGQHALPSSAYSLSSADYDNDGDLDLFITGRDVRPDGTKSKSLLGNPIPYHDANNGGQNVLLANESHFQFVDVTDNVGLNANNHRFSQAASWEDYDNDGDVDLYVANDFGRNNLYENRGGTFVDVASQAGVEDISAGMSVSWGDYNNDGQMDLYVSNMFSSAGNRVAYQRQFQSEANEQTRADFRRHARGNTLFQNLGNGTFRDVSEQAGVTMGRWAWGSNFFDLNNDGWQDIVVANGFVTNEQTDDL